MDLKTFLTSCSAKNGIGEQKRICFQGSEYPLTFFSTFFALLKRYAFNAESIDCTQVSPADIALRTNTSFLGMASLFWLRGIHELDAKKKQHMVQFLQQYNGPHQLIWYMPDDDILKKSTQIVCVQLPEAVDGALFELLAHFFEKTLAAKNVLFKKNIVAENSYSLDAACLLISYAHVLSKDLSPFQSQWLEKIVPSEKSLFSLSQHFFAKNSTSFFQQWSSVEYEYAMPFWITFWSEQLWRATGFIQYQNKNQLVAAKKISYRLPFSFMQRDWKKVSVAELQQAHDFLYGLDYFLKNHSEERVSLDLFYAKFFGNQFR